MKGYIEIVRLLLMQEGIDINVFGILNQKSFTIFKLFFFFYKIKNKIISFMEF